MHSRILGAPGIYQVIDMITYLYKHLHKMSDAKFMLKVVSRSQVVKACVCKRCIFGTKRDSGNVSDRKSARNDNICEYREPF